MGERVRWTASQVVAGLETALLNGGCALVATPGWWSVVSNRQGIKTDGKADSLDDAKAKAEAKARALADAGKGER